MGLWNLFKKKEYVEMHKITLKISAKELNLVTDYLEREEEKTGLMVGEFVSCNDVQCGDVRSIRVGIVAEESGYSIGALMLEGSDNLFEPDVIETLPNRKHLLGMYSFTRFRKDRYELTIEME